MVDRISVLYAENDIELSWSIGPSVICDEIRARKQHDRSYMCGLGFHDIELLWSIRLGVDFDKNQTRQLREW